MCEALPQEFLGSLSMYIHLKYLSTSHHEHIGVVHVVVLNYNTTQIDGYFVLSTNLMRALFYSSRAFYWYQV